MALDPLTAGLDLAKSVMDKIFPDKNDADRAKVALEVAYLEAEKQSRSDQSQITQAEASSTDPFTSRARPTIIYICGLGLVWAYFIYPLLCFFALVFHWVQQPPVIPTEGLITLLLSVLGLGGLRTWEKIQGVDSKKVGG